ncbi:MAG: hypothetical protein ACI8S6_000132 [Myxococcota bacterium]|jgi:hypothetical protein
MKIRRRALTGTPLLVASAGAMLTIASCSGATSGNLVAPARVELCVTVDPDEAVVTVEGIELPADDRCTDIYEGPNTITATAEGFVDYSEQLEFYEDTTHNIEMAGE